jgi:hypothetical protein
VGGWVGGGVLFGFAVQSKVLAVRRLAFAIIANARRS